MHCTFIRIFAASNEGRTLVATPVYLSLFPSYLCLFVVPARQATVHKLAESLPIGSFLVMVRLRLGRALLMGMVLPSI
jgi:hypothetical protein